MKFSTILVAAVFALAPTLSIAGPESCGYGHASEQASSCAEGFGWDAATQKCVEQVSS